MARRSRSKLGVAEVAETNTVLFSPELMRFAISKSV